MYSIKHGSAVNYELLAKVIQPVLQYFLLRIQYYGVNLLLLLQSMKDMQNKKIIKYIMSGFTDL